MNYKTTAFHYKRPCYNKTMSTAKYDEPTLVKKYANRRLYDTVRSIYITQDDLREMVKTGEEFLVVDAKSGEDLTRSVLTQIILDLETNGEGGVLPVTVLRQLIHFYGEKTGEMLPSYMEHAMQNFVQQQEQMQTAWAEYLNGLFPMNPMQQLAQQNAALFQQGLDMLKAMTPHMPGEKTNHE